MVYYVTIIGNLGSFDVDEIFGVHPVFYFKTDINYAGGTGTPIDPILIN